MQFTGQVRAVDLDPRDAPGMRRYIMREVMGVEVQVDVPERSDIGEFLWRRYKDQQPMTITIEIGEGSAANAFG